MESNAGARIRLCVFDLQTRQRTVILSGTDAISMAWTRTGDLLYTAPSVGRRFFSIYAANAQGGAKRELIRNAAAPTPSPNGKWIAFLSGAIPIPTSAAGQEAKPFASPAKNKGEREKFPMRSEGADAIMEITPIG